MSRNFDGDFDAVNQRSLTIAEVTQILDIAKAARDGIVGSPNVYLYDAKITVCDADSVSPIATIWWNVEAELWCIDFGTEEEK
jgi:hypothetical protein